MDYQNLFLTTQGRIKPRTFRIGFGLIFIADIIVYLLILATREHLGILALLFSLLYLVLLYPGVCIGIKRFHDRDKSGWWVLIALVPLIGGLWYIIECCFLSGTPGPNQYGPDPVTA
jgi:uncharacterized membrane protein YhaH (DUF805 family)